MARYARTKPKRLTQKLLQIRIGLNLSQNQMLEKLGLSESLFRSSISSYELGASQPPLPVLLSYARLAGVCLDVLVDDEMDLPKKMPSKPAHTSGSDGTLNKSKR
jgi:transcriptional regulator with XRE-family HTH domain